VYALNTVGLFQFLSVKYETHLPSLLYNGFQGLFPWG